MFFSGKRLEAKYYSFFDIELCFREKINFETIVFELKKYVSKTLYFFFILEYLIIFFFSNKYQYVLIYRTTEIKLLELS